MKIWCSLANRPNSNLLFARISKILLANHHQLKFSGYSINYPFHKSFFCLDNIASAYELCTQTFDNKEIDILISYIQQFAPDLIISDLDPIISFLAPKLNIPIWQVSPLLLYFGLDTNILNNDLLYKKHRLTLSKEFSKLVELADKRLIYSPFGDIDNFVMLKNGFEWSRPYSLNNEKNITGEKFLIIDLYQNKSISTIKNDTTIYLDVLQYQLKFNDYINALENSNILIHDGLTDILADGFYNSKRNLMFNQISNAECYINNVLAKHFNLAENILNIKNSIPIPILSQKSKYLTELLI